MPIPHALITPNLLGTAILDRLQFSVFADHPRVHPRRPTFQETRHALEYMENRPGTTLHNDPKHPLGQHIRFKEGSATNFFGIGPKSFSMAVVQNLSRDLAAEHDPAARKARHGNTAQAVLKAVPPDVIRRLQCEMMAEVAVRSKERYLDLCPKILGRQVFGSVNVNLSQVELAYDVPDVSADLLAQYVRPFQKIFVTRLGADSKRLSGMLRKGERFAVYFKEEAGVLRFEASLSGIRVKEVSGSQRAPETAAAADLLVRQLEERYLPTWIEMERHRLPETDKSWRDVIGRFPNVKDPATLDHVAGALATTGKVWAGAADGALLTALGKRGMVENLLPKTRVRGWRVTAPAWDGFWRSWHNRS